MTEVCSENSDAAKCELCGEPMPDGETMFKFHGYSGPCPKPPLPKDTRSRASSPLLLQQRVRDNG